MARKTQREAVIPDPSLCEFPLEVEGGNVYTFKFEGRGSGQIKRIKVTCNTIPSTVFVTDRLDPCRILGLQPKWHDGFEMLVFEHDEPAHDPNKPVGLNTTPVGESPG